MKCNLIISINEVTVRDYTLVEDEGLNALIAGSRNIGCEGLNLTYEDDEDSYAKQVIVIDAPSLPILFRFLEFAEMPVKIVT